ncbi:hypothetical protein M902_2731 [Bacteriovorax sp. BAL6_X]|uniref:hypothetical protein n=1 Tax=Bacteriovorax sp. BAL6_X TaxID=1201290 RepID=UPI0003866BB0|nr:hypothetical protein [Bacteriovorax sp. BAL6_X]EPZ51386.1 hypothetical protein M902_2731 [Bacteriovorax sp. BAL6_X]
MKKLLLISTIILQTIAFAGVSDWSIVNIKGDFWLKKKDSKTLKAKITKRTGKSKVTETKSVGENYELIIYYSGSAGTFQLIDIYYAVIFDKKKNQFLGDYPWAYKAQEASKKVDNPKWDISEKSIKIIDQQTDLNKTIELRSN